MILSLPCPIGPYHTLNTERVAAGVAASHASPRRRMVVPIQRSEAATVQRMLNIFQPGSYVRPHRHPRPQAVETICVLQGALAAYIFDDAGKVVWAQRLVPGVTSGLLDIEPMVWHTFAALEPDTIVLEIKGGPYDQKLDKLWPDWAPAESGPASEAYLASLEQALVG